MKERPEQEDLAIRDALRRASDDADPDAATRQRVRARILAQAGPELRRRRMQSLAERLLRTARWTIPAAIAAALVLAFFVARPRVPDAGMELSPAALFLGGVIGIVPADSAVDAAVGSADGTWFLAEVVSHE
ncbi:MAG TPA: hypothetical protein VGA78_10435 [Gemmatimonadales bacterium]